MKKYTQEQLDKEYNDYVAWLELNDQGRTLDFYRADLSGLDLSGKEWFLADFSEANLSGANLSGADVRGCSFGGCNLQGANIRGIICNNEFLNALRYHDIKIQPRIYQDDPFETF